MWMHIKNSRDFDLMKIIWVTFFYIWIHKNKRNLTNEKQSGVEVGKLRRRKRRRGLSVMVLVSCQYLLPSPLSSLLLQWISHTHKTTSNQLIFFYKMMILRWSVRFGIRVNNHFHNHSLNILLLTQL